MTHILVVNQEFTKPKTQPISAIAAAPFRRPKVSKFSLSLGTNLQKPFTFLRLINELPWEAQKSHSLTSSLSLSSAKNSHTLPREKTVASNSESRCKIVEFLSLKLVGFRVFNPVKNPLIWAPFSLGSPSVLGSEKPKKNSKSWVFLRGLEFRHTRRQRRRRKIRFFGPKVSRFPCACKGRMF